MKDSTFIPVHDPRRTYLKYRNDVNEKLTEVMESGSYILGPMVEELEESLARFVGVKHSVAVSSGTDALLISLMALGVGPGDEVITSAFSFVSTAEVIVRIGAIPVFVDVDRGTALLNIEQVVSRVTRRTKAVIVVSLYGSIPAMDELKSRLDASIPIIEDAAQSFGSTYKGLKSCGISEVGCTSFFPTKPLGCMGDGGAIFTTDDQIAKRAREIRNHGQARKYEVVRPGVSGRLDSVQAAVLLVYLDNFQEIMSDRFRIGGLYRDALDGLGVSQIQVPQEVISINAQMTVLVSDRDRFCRELKRYGVSTAIHYPRTLMSYEPINEKAKCGEIPDAYFLSSRVVSLPMFPELTDDELQIIFNAIAELRESDDFFIS